MQYTSAGLPYPSSQDSVCQIDDYIKQLAQAIDYRLANPSLSFFYGPLATNTNGEAVQSFPSLAAVAGAVCFPLQNQSPPVALVGTVPTVAGINVTTKWVYTSTVAWSVQGFYGTVWAAVIAWGTPK